MDMVRSVDVKHSIAWHEECIKNTRDYLAEQERELKRKEQSVHELRERCSFYDCQIITAKDENKDFFDSELYLKKRQPKEVVT